MFFNVLDLIPKGRDAGEYSSLAFWGPKAFNCFNHKILLEILAHYGFKSRCLQRFNTDLQNRSQFTQINNNNSNIAAAPSGVPQGSILRPILFLYLR